MTFRTFDGRLWLALHHPNPTPDERPKFIPLQKTGRSLALA
jgi:arabinan endo-1,5-alpha-L-arabinosidase